VGIADECIRGDVCDPGDADRPAEGGPRAASGSTLVELNLLGEDSGVAAPSLATMAAGAVGGDRSKGFCKPAGIV
jgi:hypothetical protein